MNVLTKTKTEEEDWANYKIAINPSLPIEQYNKEFWWLFSKTSLKLLIDKKSQYAGKEVEINIILRKFGASTTEPQLKLSKELKKFTLLKEQNLYQFKEKASLPKAPFSLLILAPKGSPNFLLEKLQFSVDGKTESLLNKKYSRSSE